MPATGASQDTPYQLLTEGTDVFVSDVGKRRGLFRAIFLVCVCCTGSFLFAYDTGIVGGILTLPSFQHDFRYTDEEKTHVNSNAVSVLQAGAFFGCFGIWPITASLGRRLPLALCSIVFSVGGVLQTLNLHSIGLFYTGRIISGVGVGGATVLIPIYSSEMSPTEIRGKLGACFQLFFAVGVCVSYWVDYAVQVGVRSSKSSQWQIPVGLQLVPGVLLGLGMLFLKESTRWLAKNGHMEEAYDSLKWIRGGEDNHELRSEFAAIQTGVQKEAQESERVTRKELMRPGNRYRIFLAITIQLCAQLTGNSSLAYYAPQIFQSVGAGDDNLFITGFFGLSKIVGVVVFQHFLVEHIGRRTPFIFGAMAMGFFMVMIAGILAIYPPDAVTNIASSGVTTIIMIYAEALAFNMSWGPLPWLYISEIFSNSTREIGVAAGAASQWLFNFVMSQATPRAIANLRWKTFLMFAIFNYAIAAYSWLLLKETNGSSLEEMNTLFGQGKLKVVEEDRTQSEQTPRLMPTSP